VWFMLVVMEASSNERQKRLFAMIEGSSWLGLPFWCYFRSTRSVRIVCVWIMYSSKEDRPTGAWPRDRYEARALVVALEPHEFEVVWYDILIRVPSYPLAHKVRWQWRLRPGSLLESTQVA
jgi:hypothetical protein